MANQKAERGKRFRVFRVFRIVFFAVLAVGLAAGARAGDGLPPYLYISDWKTGEIYASSPVKIGSELFFGWTHSLEKIPWNEYYHIDENLIIVLDAITFPAFGAGIPENKGRVCYVDESGLIHMEEIGQEFKELVWLNSHTATREILLDGKFVAKGDSLPQHTRLRLTVEKGR